MDLVSQVQVLDETVSISLCSNNLVKGMNPSVLPLDMSKYLGRLDSLVLPR